MPHTSNKAAGNPNASKLQQLPWTTVFADLQLLLLSADAPGLSPYSNACVCTCLHMFRDHTGQMDVNLKGKHILQTRDLYPKTMSICHPCHAMFPTQWGIASQCKPVQASFSSCLGQLFSKIFNFFCVPLTLLVWLLNASVCACMDAIGNGQEKQI